MSDHGGDLDGVFAELEAAAGQAETLTAADILEVIGARGFGPVLVILSAILILPVAVIPGLPAVVALVMAMVGVAMLLGRRRLRLPERIGRLAIKASRIHAVAIRVRPWTARVRRVLRPRLSFLATSPPAIAAIGAVLIATGIVVFFIGFIPFLPLLMALHVLAMGLGLAMRDGVAIIAGFALMVPTVVLVMKLV